MANAENIQRVIDALEAERVGEHQLRFDMGDWLAPLVEVFDLGDATDEEDYVVKHPHCGTSACIGGTAHLLMAADNPNGEKLTDSDVAAWLGLSEWAGARLFYMQDTEHSLMSVTKEQAIQMLHHIKDTGVVDWHVVLGEY